MSQLNLASIPYLSKKKRTRREVFLSEMDAVIPWVELVSLIKPHYPTEGRVGRQPFPIEQMLRIYFLQQFFNLSDVLMEDSLYDSESMRRFARIELGEDTVPDATTIMNFRHLLEAHKLTRRAFKRIDKYLCEQGVVYRKGTIVDASIINAPSSTKNAAGKRDPDMTSTRKGNQWYFGMKVHIGTDSETGLAHSVAVTTAKKPDPYVLTKLLHGQERALYGDKAYDNKRTKALFESRGIRWRVARKGCKDRLLTERDQLRNAKHNKVRAKVEHAFNVVKNLWGHRKVRYRGLGKNGAQFFSLFGLANLFLARRELLNLQPQGT